MTSAVVTLQSRAATSPGLPLVYTSQASCESIACSPPYWGPDTCSAFGYPSTTNDSTNFHGYVQTCPDDVRKSLATYFSTGQASELNITDNNFHHFFHAGRLSQHTGLTRHCFQYYENSQSKDTILKIIEPVCHCCWCSLLQDANSGYMNCSCTEETVSTGPEYAVLFITRGDNDKKQKVASLRITRPLKKYTKEINKLNRFGQGFAACSVQIEDSPYVIISGGEGKSEKIANLYDVVLNKWEKPVKLNFSRQQHMMAVVKDVVYIFGGIGTTSVERFDPVTKSCDIVCDLRMGVHSAAFAVHRSRIYIFGGKVRGNDVSTVQYIDTETRRSHVLGNLPCTCSGSQSVVIGNDMYIATGQGHMIRFNVNVEKSEMCADQISRRTQFALFVKETEIFMVGGKFHNSNKTEGGKEPNETVCKYCPETDTWSVLHRLEISLHVSASCVVRYSKKCPIIPFHS